jgi:hypothetical protein
LRHLQLDRMEDVMLGSKRTVPLWRQRQRRLLALERALAPSRNGHGQPYATAEGIAGARARDRLTAEAKRKGRFSDR